MCRVTPAAGPSLCAAGAIAVQRRLAPGLVPELSHDARSQQAVRGHPGGPRRHQPGTLSVRDMGFHARLARHSGNRSAGDDPVHVVAGESPGPAIHHSPLCAARQPICGGECPPTGALSASSGFAVHACMPANDCTTPLTILCRGKQRPSFSVAHGARGAACVHCPPPPPRACVVPFLYVRNFPWHRV